MRTTQRSGMKRLLSAMYGVAHLRERDERLRLRIVVQAGIARVGHDADDLARRLREIGAHAGADDEALADGFCVLPILLRHGLVDDHHRRRGGIVAFGEDAAADDRDLEDIEEARAST